VARQSSSNLAHSTTLLNHQSIAAKQAHKHYTSLFSSKTYSDIPARSWHRQGTGVIVQMLQHSQLTAEQWEAIGEYRLDQYVLAGLYDVDRVNELGLTADPNLLHLPDSTVHLVVGDSEHHLLCYASFEPAHMRGSNDKHQSQPLELSSSDSSNLLMRDRQRPLFPVEFAFGLQLYASHPAISELPVAYVREMMRMVRNQALRVPLTSLSPIEVVVAASRLLRDPLNQIEALVGCASPELRRLSQRLNVPVAYAPDAIDHLSEHSAALDSAIWTPKALELGRFWPLALSLADVQAAGEFFDMLDVALDGGNLRQVLIACQDAQRHAPEITSAYCYTPPPDHSGSMQWVPYKDSKQR
jgi:hypothetical protein